VYTVLILDPEPRMRDLVRTILNKGGYRVLEAEGFVEVMEAIEHETPDLVLVDVTQGSADAGFDLLHEIRLLPRMRSVPVLFTTGIPDQHIEDRLRNCGATAYLMKPFNRQDLLVAVGIALGLQGAAAGAAAAAVPLYASVRAS